MKGLVGSESGSSGSQSLEMLLVLTKHFTKMERHLGETIIKGNVKLESILWSSFGQIILGWQSQVHSI